jgi:hypothetical protein
MNYHQDQDLHRIARIIGESIELFQLDLTELTVLTEAANGSYFVTPIIAALAGGQVRALAKDSSYGKKSDVVKYVSKRINSFKLHNSIEIVTELSDSVIQQSNIVTNLGLLRPIGSSFIEAMNNKAVITSMCEDWEIRNEDIDLPKCREKGILVGAVNEESSLKNIFHYVGFLAMKLILEAGLEVYNNRFLIVSSDKFGDTIANVLKKNGAEAEIVNTNSFISLARSNNVKHNNSDDSLKPKTAISEKTAPTLPGKLPGSYDALVIADFSYRNPIIAQERGVDAVLLKRLYPESKIIHLAGEVAADYLNDNEIICYPLQNGVKQRMSKTLDYLGIRPLIELHTAGLKVGEMLAKERLKGIGKEKIHKMFNEQSLCQILS